uniref:Amastin-like surface protein, putative n=1 Tax=Leishmania guyanensis TaxID=5670 RepID=A0A1E1J9K0_LEIGU|nr:amastin-like surface protein, putative [Leishmania guyanensis]
MECVTLWGFKRDCISTLYIGVSDKWWFDCTSRRDRFRAAQGFAVISVFVYGAAFVLGVIMLFCSALGLPGAELRRRCHRVHRLGVHGGDVQQR